MISNLYRFLSIWIRVRLIWSTLLHPFMSSRSYDGRYDTIRLFEIVMKYVNQIMKIFVIYIFQFWIHFWYDRDFFQDWDDTKYFPDFFLAVNIYNQYSWFVISYRDIMRKPLISSRDRLLNISCSSPILYIKSKMIM